jgi:hypothetical protein
MAVPLAAGCAEIGTERVAGWPELKVVEHRVPHKVMRDRCSPYVPFWMSPEACSEFNFVRGTCDVWLSAEFPPPAFVVRHELEHCQGYEHVGEHALRDILARSMLQQHNANIRQAAAPPVVNDGVPRYPVE